MLFSKTIIPDKSIGKSEFLYRRYLVKPILSELKSPEYFFKGISTCWSKYCNENEAKFEEDVNYNNVHFDNINNINDCKYKQFNNNINLASIKCSLNDTLFSLDLKGKIINIKMIMTHDPRICNFPHSLIKFELQNEIYESMSNSLKNILFKNIKTRIIENYFEY